MRTQDAIKKLDARFRQWERANDDAQNFDGDRRGHYSVLIKIEEQIIKLCDQIVKQGLE